MIIQLCNLGKRFNRDWIFRHINYTFTPNKSYAITGPNGSGKSTLLQAVAGAITLSEGAIEYRPKNKEHRIGSSEKVIKRLTRESKMEDLKVEIDEVYKHISITAPYLELIEEMTATELLRFHTSFKPLLPQLGILEILEIVGLTSAANKQIHLYSSGMKQRIKMALAFFSDVPVILLDEPCTNLDAKGYKLYHQLLNEYCKNKLVIVSSNDVNEYDFCEERLNILDWK